MKIKAILTALLLLFGVSSFSATPIHHYDFNNNGVLDLVGTINGVLKNGATITSGKLLLDGNDDYVVFNTPIIPQQGNFSVAFFVQAISPGEQGKGYGCVIQQGTSGQGNFYLDDRVSNQDHYIRVSDDWQDTGIKFPSDGLIHHYSITTSSTNTKLYIDGSLIASKSVSIGMNTNAVATYLGGGGWPGFYIYGNIDDLWIFNGVLTDSEVSALALYAAPKIVSFTATPKFGNPPLPVNFVVTAKDPDGKIASYNWDFNSDGKTDQATTTGKLTHIYNELGTLNASVTVVDDKGAETKSNTIPITIAYGPDLVGKVEAFSFNNTTKTIHIDFKITNQGDIPVSGFLTTFNLSNNGTTVASKFSEARTEKLAVGESKSFSIDQTFVNSIYGRWLLILVDPNKEVAEINEKNNGSRVIVQSAPTN
jgi:PKD repeat protein